MNTSQSNVTTADQSAAVIKARAAVAQALLATRSIDLSALSPPAQFTSWSLASDTLSFLVHLVDLLRPRHILEFGSGLSTRVLAWECARQGYDCCITSIEHDPEYADLVRAELESQTLKCRTRVVSAPLVVRQKNGTPVPVYYCDTRQLTAQQSPDLVLVDGPPQLMGGRRGILFQVMECAKPGTVVLLDDANREAERCALEMWKNEFREAIDVHHLDGFKQGLAAIFICSPEEVDSEANYEAYLSDVLQELEKIIPEGARFIIAQKSHWSCRPIGSVGNQLLEKGLDWSPPASDQQAIEEVREFQRTGACFLVFARTSYWWFNYYSLFVDYLQSNSRCVIRNHRFSVFELTTDTYEISLGK